MENDKILQKMFDLVNQKYFNNELPQIKLQWNNRTSSSGFFTYTWLDIGNKEPSPPCKFWHGRYFKKVPEKIEISFPYFDKRKRNGEAQEVLETMIEECVHYWQCLTNRGDGHDYWYYWKMQDVGLSVSPKTRQCERLDEGKNWLYRCENPMCNSESKANSTTVRKLKGTRICRNCKQPVKVYQINNE